MLSCLLVKNFLRMVLNKKLNNHTEIFNTPMLVQLLKKDIGTTYTFNINDVLVENPDTEQRRVMRKLSSYLRSLVGFSFIE